MTKREAEIAHKNGVTIQYTGGQLSVGKWTDIVFSGWDFNESLGGSKRTRYRIKPTLKAPK